MMYQLNFLSEQTFKYADIQLCSMVQLNHAKIDEAILYAENTYGLMVHLDFDFYNNLARKRMNGTYDKNKALLLLSKYFVPRVVKLYKKEIGSNNISRMNVAEKNEVADYFLRQLWNEGGFTLDNTPLKDIRKGDKIKLREVTELGSYANRERVKSY